MDRSAADLPPEIYHAHHQLHLEDLAFWQSLARELGGPMLELGCGTGRVLIPLAEAGYRVTGLDCEPAALAFLQSRLPPDCPERIDLIHGDMTRFRIDNRFKFILFPCNTCSTLTSEERQMTFHRVHEHLAAEGLFAFSIPNPSRLLSIPSRGDSDLEDVFPHPQTGAPVWVISRWERQDGHRDNPGSNYPVMTFNWDYIHFHPEGYLEQFSATTRHFVDPVEVYLLDLEKAGLEPKTMFGDFQRTAYSPDSIYLIVLARVFRPKV